MEAVRVFWFRRDLRLEDNAGLWKALKSGHPVLPIFIFDRHILDRLQDKSDARVSFLHQTILRLQKELEALGSSLRVFYSTPEEVMVELSQEYDVRGLYLNRDYEPYARERDAAVAQFWSERGVDVIGAKDHVIFEKNEVVKADGTAYLVYSPYAKAWRKKLTTYHGKAYPNHAYSDQFITAPAFAIPSLSDMGFEPTKVALPSEKVREDIIKTYDTTRNFPANEQSTTRLGLHLRFGTLSIRALLRRALTLNETFVSELIWRDFFQMALFYFPESRSKTIKPKYDRIPWEFDQNQFDAWCNGTTGYPIVDAGMRELNATGYMHNRVRMIVASFLTKHLLMDWRLGEAYFAEKLLDFDLASNIGGWQWASGSGLDAAPYFRVFNPTSQMEKFDKDRSYIRKWVPEWGTSSYPEPIVEHKWARERCLATYKEALSNA
jgi:deoxyribodipyrimidine photo-lyase